MAVPGPAALTPFPVPSLRLSQYDAACQLAQEVAERIQERSRHRRNGESSAKVRRGAPLGLGALLYGAALIGREMASVLPAVVTESRFGNAFFEALKRCFEERCVGFAQRSVLLTRDSNLARIEKRLWE